MTLKFVENAVLVCYKGVEKLLGDTKKALGQNRPLRLGVRYRGPLLEGFHCIQYRTQLT